MARILLLAALLPICSHAACFDGEWVDALWEPASCTLPVLEHATNHCLANRNILWIGGSTNRQLVHNLVRRWGVKMDHLPCNLELGHGCFDCERGCHSLRYHEGRGEDKEWNDMIGTTPTGHRIRFSWKPQMFSLDDETFLEGVRSSGEKYDAVIVHKGIHTSADWTTTLKDNKVPETLFMEENRVRAMLLADLLIRHFPGIHLIWRDVYHNHIAAEIEDIDDRLRSITTPIFQQRGFTILPGHGVTVGLPEVLHADGVHPDDRVVEVLLQMLASVICPLAAEKSTVRTRISTTWQQLQDTVQARRQS